MFFTRIIYYFFYTVSQWISQRTVLRPGPNNANDAKPKQGDKASYFTIAPSAVSPISASWTWDNCTVSLWMLGKLLVLSNGSQFVVGGESSLNSASSASSMLSSTLLANFYFANNALYSLIDLFLPPSGGFPCIGFFRTRLLVILSAYFPHGCFFKILYGPNYCASNFCFASFLRRTYCPTSSVWGLTIWSRIRPCLTAFSRNCSLPSVALSRPYWYGLVANKACVRYFVNISPGYHSGSLFCHWNEDDTVS